LFALWRIGVQGFKPIVCTPPLAKTEVATVLNKLIILLVLIPPSQFVPGQTSSDWEKRYGPPEAARFAIQEGIYVTVFYSTEGQTCKAVIEANKPESVGKFEGILEQVVPVADRGNLKQMFGFTSTVNGISSAQYERVTISKTSVTLNDVETVDSATVTWKGIQCKADRTLPILKGQPLPSPKT
jgi:hypothetical protein